MTDAPSPDRLTATYRLWRGTGAQAEEAAAAIAREQTLEVPAGVASDTIEATLLGRVEDVAPAPGGGFDATISYALGVTGTDLPQLLNVAYGNVSLMNGVRLVDLVLPAEILEALPGPRFGIDGLREMVGAGRGRSLVGVAIKPLGRTSLELADLAATFVAAGVDVIKDDHGLTNQDPAPFRERVAAVGEAVARANAAGGRKAAYFPNATGPVDTLEDRLACAESAGCPGILLCPSVLGLDVMRAVASGPRRLGIMAHPAYAQSAPSRLEGIAPDVLYGTMYRVAGADVVVYPNAGGRYPWPLPACDAIAARLRAPLGPQRPAMPAPAGGIDASDAGHWFTHYGPDTILLIGGSLLAQDDPLEATRRVVRAAVTDRRLERGHE